MKVLVCGGRKFTDKNKLWTTLDAIRIHTLIHGGARGADSLADEYGRVHGIKILCFPARWTEYGNAAGYIRNKQMLDEGQPELVVSFAGGKGTAMMTQIARDAGVEVRVID